MNTIVYGKSGSGKTYNYFIKKINEFDGKVIGISYLEENMNFEDLESNKKFKKYRLDDSTGLNIEEVFNHDKVFLEIPLECEEYLLTNNIIKIIEYLYKNGLKEKLLIDINNIDNLNLEHMIKIGNTEVSLIKALVDISKDPRVDIVMILQELKILKKQYPKEYDELIKNSNIICTRELQSYSGEYKLRMPRSLHKRLMEEAVIEGVSFNQYLVYKLMGGSTNNIIRNSEIKIGLMKNILEGKESHIIDNDGIDNDGEYKAFLEKLGNPENVKVFNSTKEYLNYIQNKEKI